jgi:hypothetical protein
MKRLEKEKDTSKVEENHSLINNTINNISISELTLPQSKIYLYRKKDFNRIEKEKSNSNNN